MYRPKRTIPGLLVVALTVAGCGNGEGTADNGDGRTASGATGGGGGMGGGVGSGGSAGSDGIGGGGGSGGFDGVGGSPGAGGVGGVGGVGGTRIGQAVEAYCMKLGDCYSEVYAEGCLAQFPDLEVLAQSLSPECDELVGSYFSCLADLTCEELMGDGDSTCETEIEEEPLLVCDTVIPQP